MSKALRRSIAEWQGWQRLKLITTFITVLPGDLPEVQAVLAIQQRRVGKIQLQTGWTKRDVHFYFGSTIGTYKYLDQLAADGIMYHNPVQNQWLVLWQVELMPYLLRDALIHFGVFFVLSLMSAFIFSEPLPYELWVVFTVAVLLMLLTLPVSYWILRIRRQQLIAIMTGDS